jgi:cytochrome P450
LTAVAPASPRPGQRLKRIRDLPGPPGPPLLGNALQINSERLHRTLEKWAGEYGSAFRIRITSREFVVVSNPETVSAILRDRPDGFQRSSRFSEAAKEMGFSGVLSAGGDAWKRQRPMVLSGLDPSHLKVFFPTLAKVTERLSRRWRHAAARDCAIDLQPDLMRYTVDVTAGLAFGSDINTLESNEEVIQSHLDKVLPAFFKRVMAPLRYWRYVKLPADRRIERHLAALRSAVQAFISEARQRLDRNPQLREQPRNLIEAMLSARDREGSGLTDEDVSGNVLTMLLAGEDTTANTLAWMIWLMHRSPEAARHAADEARSVLADKTHLTDYQHLNQLEFIEACAHETMRLKPVVPINTVQALRDTAVEGIALPAGSLVICLMRPAAVDSNRFPDPCAFRPERWLAGTPESAFASKRVAMPFGAGPRICPGRYLALAEMKMVIATLFGTFDIASVSTPDGAEPRERLTLTMSPVGLRMRLRDRNPEGAQGTSPR